MDQETRVMERVPPRDAWERPAFEDITVSAEAAAYMGTWED